MISDARGSHVSPGIYVEEKDVTYSVKSLGITSLGLVGETLFGPAFENIPIENWTEFIDYFGGTSSEKFKGTGLPKYELPYIAKSYLEESKRLNVVRVLGLSGYHAGPAWAIKYNNKIIGILRSKMTYESAKDECLPYNKTQRPEAIVKTIALTACTEYLIEDNCTATGNISAITSNKFSIKVTTIDEQEYTYNLSLEPNDSTYIYNVLSSSPDTGTTPVYIEALYESSFSASTATTASFAIEQLDNTLSSDTAYFKVVEENCNEYVLEYIGDNQPNDSNETNTKEDKDKKYTSRKNKVGLSYVTTPKDEIYKYVQAKISVENGLEVYDNYLEGYRAAQTPWIVSDAVVIGSGDTLSASVKTLFKFITISDGNNANYQVKVSIENIDPVLCTFDVVVRDFYDTDEAPIVLERFRKCNLVDGDANYIAYKIGTSDGGFVSKSKYILVEMAENENLKNNIPAGFLGYPMPQYAQNNTVEISYNTKYNTEIKAKKQYFGLSNLAYKGIEKDIFSYKGVDTYYGDGVITDGFHMDSLVTRATVDNSKTYSFKSVQSGKVTTDKYIPRLINLNGFLKESLYKDIKTRKFTVCFYGGFDGWDVNRTSRTNTDEYKSSKLTPDEYGVFRYYKENDEDGNLPLNLPSTAITSDYYAYLAGYRVFINPQDIDINVFATPGINWYDNKFLTEEVIDIIEDSEDGRGGDAIYIMASPTNMDANEVSALFRESDINSSYACTYSPWVLYFDANAKRYLNLPVTKDVVRNMAATDNNSYPWFAPAGIERGNVKCVKAEYKTTLADEDELYADRVNPVKTFAQDGVKIWGNKTAYNVESPLNRINVRRLMIRVKKLVTNAAKNLIFTQYDDTLEKQFRGLIDPILAEVKSNRGISDYRIITEVTPETRDQHILPAKILIKPTPALEYISLSFVVYPESVSFDEN